VVLLLASVLLLAVVSLAQRWGTGGGNSRFGRSIERLRNLFGMGNTGA
jgi:hypothetical protein